MFHQRQFIESSAIDLPSPRQPAASFLGSQIDLPRIWGAVRDQRLLVAGATILSLLAVGLFGAVAPSKYKATTEILIDPSDLHVVANGLTTSNAQMELAVMQVESQVRVLTSDNVMQRVVESEKLDSDPLFASSGQSLLRSLVSSITAPFGRGSRGNQVSPARSALLALQKRIKVHRTERTYVVDVIAEADDPEKSARIANAMAQAYLAEVAAARFDTARRVSQSLTSRLSDLKDGVRVAAERVEQFKAEHHLIGVDGQLVNEQQLKELNNQLTLAHSRTTDAQSKYEQIQALQRSGSDIGAFTEALQSTALANLRYQYAEVVRREAEQSTSLGARHPAVIEIRAEEQRLHRLINEEIKRVALAARNEYERASATEKSFARSLETLKHSAVTTNEAQVQLRELERELKASRAVYESFLVRSRETGEQEKLDTRNIRIISRAEAPQNRSWPPSFMLLGLAGLVFGASFGVAIAVCRDYRREFGEKSRHADEAPLPTLARLTRIDTRHPLKTLSDDNSLAAICRLHDALLAHRKKWNGERILITSPHDDGEAAAVAISLAQIAAANRKVLVIDADMRRQALAAIAPNSGQVGLMDVASGRARLAEAVVHDDRTNLSVLPLFGQKHAAFGNIQNSQIEHALKVTKRFDLLLVLAPTRAGNPVGSFFAALVDEIVLIADARKKEAGLYDAVLALDAQKHKVRGVIFAEALSPSAAVPLEVRLA